MKIYWTKELDVIYLFIYLFILFILFFFLEIE